MILPKSCLLGCLPQRGLKAKLKRKPLCFQETAAPARSLCHGLQQTIKNTRERPAHDACRTVRTRVCCSLSVEEGVERPDVPGMGGWGRAPQPQYFWCDICLGFFLCLGLLPVNPGRNKAAREHGSSSLGWAGVVEVLHRLLGRLSLSCKVGSTKTPGGDVHNAKVLPENSRTAVFLPNLHNWEVTWAERELVEGRNQLCPAVGTHAAR